MGALCVPRSDVSPRAVEIRPPLLARAGVLIFMTVWCGLLITGGIRALRSNPSPVLIVLVFMLAVGVTLGYRMFRMSVVAEGDTLLVRNTWRTFRWSSRDVHSFNEVRGSNNVPWGRSAQVILADRTAVNLDVTQTGLALTAGSRTRMRDSLEQLRAWKRHSANE